MRAGGDVVRVWSAQYRYFLGFFSLLEEFNSPLHTATKKSEFQLRFWGIWPFSDYEKSEIVTHVLNLVKGNQLE